MPDAKLTALSAVGTPAGADLLYLVDVDDTTDDAAGSSRKVTVAQINATLTSGANTWALAQTFTAAPVFTDQSGARSALGLGTLATQNGTFSGTSSGTNTGDQTSVTGNAGTATTLQTARALNGVDFNGSAAVTVPTLVSSVNAGALRGYIDGLITSRASATTVTVGAGTARDSTDAHCLYLSASTTKTLQASGSWAAGTGNNGLDTGARANSTWYHVWVISLASGASPDVLFSTSATSPTMPGSYTLKRRVGSVRTDGSGNIVAWVQYGDEFYWDVPVNDVTASNPGTSAVTRTLTVPTGVVVKALIAVRLAASASADNPSGCFISPLALADTASSATVFSPAYSFSGLAGNTQVGLAGFCWTNTSGQVRSRLQVSGATTVVAINTNGWVDPRGQDQ